MPHLFFSWRSLFFDPKLIAPCMMKPAIFNSYHLIVVQLFVRCPFSIYLFRGVLICVVSSSLLFGLVHHGPSAPLPQLRVGGLGRLLQMSTFYDGQRHECRMRSPEDGRQLISVDRFPQEQDVLSILLWDGSRICQNVALQASVATKNQAMFSVCGHPSPCAKEAVSAGRVHST